MKKAYFSYIYQEKIARKIRSGSSIDYFYITNNTPHKKQSFENQIIEHCNLFDFEEKAQEVVNGVLDGMEGILKKLPPEFRTYLETQMEADCLKYIIGQDVITRNILDRGYNKVIIFDKEYHRYKMVYGGKCNLIKSFLTSLYLAIYNFFFFSKVSIKTFRSGRRNFVHNLNVLFGMYGNRQDYYNNIYLIEKFEDYGIWIHSYPFDYKPIAYEPTKKIARFLFRPKLDCKSLPKLLFFAFVSLKDSVLYFRENGLLASIVFFKIFQARCFSILFRDSFRRYPDLKLIFGSFEGHPQGPIIVWVAKNRGIKFVNNHHAYADIGYRRWDTLHFDYDILPSDYWLKQVENRNSAIKINSRGSLSMQTAIRTRCMKLDEYSTNFRLISIIGTYFSDISSILNTKVCLDTVREAVECNKNWVVLIRPRASNEQYCLIVDEAFEGFPRERLIVDPSDSGEFSYAEVLSYSDLCVVDQSSAVFEAIQLNVPVVQMNFDPTPFRFPVYEKGLSYPVTYENRQEFINLFKYNNNELDNWLEQLKPHNKNWKYYIDYDSYEPVADRIAPFLKSLISGTKPKSNGRKILL